MTNKYNVLYLVKEITRQFPIFDAILAYKRYMISYFLKLASMHFLTAMNQQMHVNKGLNPVNLTSVGILSDL